MRLRLDDFPPSVRERIKEVMDAEDSRSGARHPEPQPAEALVAKMPREEIMGADAARLRVTITRRSPRPLDDDNFVGGAKQLRDAIAEMLGRKGDAERDGLEWEYRQERGAAATIIEIEEIGK